jgi:hypothetical protein
VYCTRELGNLRLMPMAQKRTSSTPDAVESALVIMAFLKNRVDRIGPKEMANSLKECKDLLEAK